MYTYTVPYGLGAEKIKPDLTDAKSGEDAKWALVNLVRAKKLDRRREKAAAKANQAKAQLTQDASRKSTEPEQGPPTAPGSQAAQRKVAKVISNIFFNRSLFVFLNQQNILETFKSSKKLI